VVGTYRAQPGNSLPLRLFARGARQARSVAALERVLLICSGLQTRKATAILRRNSRGTAPDGRRPAKPAPVTRPVTRKDRAVTKGAKTLRPAGTRLLTAGGRVSVFPIGHASEERSDFIISINPAIVLTPAGIEAPTVLRHVS